MKVLMLGWEYPPHISGGLGTACEGLTRALAGRGIEIDFLVPRLYGEESAPHMHLLGATGPEATQQVPVQLPRRSYESALTKAIATEPSLSTDPILTAAAEASRGVSPVGIRTIRVPAMLKPYLDPSAYLELLTAGGFDEAAAAQLAHELPAPPHEARRRAEHSYLLEDDLWASGAEPATEVHYGHDLFAEVARYSAAATRRVRGRKYDLVHAHDWMTFPAGIEIAARVNAPLITHVHSLEYDRAAEGADREIVAVERQGLERAKRVIAVSYYTRGLINRVHGTALDKISVVHNGVYTRATVQAYTQQRRSTGPVVLFLGRVTFQKGPEYFVQAAARVLEHVPNAKFIMAGSGDMLPRMKALVESLGIEDAFRFPGFVRGADLERTFSTADVYVMPSVSEPFGIAPLEAMSYDRPVIVSKQSGVAEVLRNALKVDFWDVDKMASQIVALLELPELRRVIVELAREEIRHI
ncbi:MAG: glycosyltransferase family 4 protein, partial [Myxococcales bacterium]|nr:glycosyltransferase family 4 protein [Myxococcales bacterium]